MIYHFLYPLSKVFSALNITKYITVRAGFAFIISFLLVILFWRFTLKRLKKLQIIERIDMYGNVKLEKLYEEKKGTPTMGGVLILFSLVTTVLLCARLDNFLIQLSLFTIVSLGALGLTDDFLKIKRGEGLSRITKFTFQCAIGAVLGLLIVLNKDYATTLDFPFFKKIIPDLGYFYLFWAAIVIAATSNAVNFTDGLDGLAIGAIVTNAFIFAFICYLSGHLKFAEYLFIPHIVEAGELSILCLALAGAGLGFLWYNSYPAQVFMGDVGALSLGGIIGAIALFTKKELLLFIAGGLFVAEALSVILQIFSVKMRGKKLFKAAPLHHHFQLMGWKEPKIIVRLWIISILCVTASLLTLKLR